MNASSIAPFALCLTGAFLCGSVFFRAADSAAPDLTASPSSPSAWADAAEQFESKGDLARARNCFARSIELGPHYAPVLLRAMNFYFRQGDVALTLATGRRLLAGVREFDGLIFSLYDRMETDEAIIRAEGIPPQHAAEEAYVQWQAAHHRDDLKARSGLGK